MSFHFRPAKRSEAKPLVGLYGESGSGKTLSALMLGRGFAGPDGKVGMIETESGRGEAYEGDPRVPGGYLVLPLRDDCSPQAFGAAIHQAEKETMDALIIDSASLEWIDGPKSVNAQASKNEEEGKKGMQVWRGPKMDHQEHFITPLLRTPIPLVILCMRARYPMERVLVNGKQVDQRSTKLEPYQSPNILFELYVHGWIDQEHKFHGTKYTRDELRQVFREGERITLETGKRLSGWAGRIDAAPREPEAPTQSELIATDFAARFDEATTLQEGKEWAGRAEKAKGDGLIEPRHWPIVESAKARARARLVK